MSENDSITVARSYLTDRIIYVNRTSNFVVSPTFTRERVQLAIDAVNERLRKVPTKSRHTLALRKILGTLGAVRLPKELMDVVDSLLTFLAEEPAAHDVVHIRETLRLLWHIDLLMWPLLPNERTQALKFTKNWEWESERLQLVESIASLQTTSASTSARRVRGLMTLIMASAGSKDIGDFTPEVVANYFETLPNSKLRQRLALDTITLQQLKYGERVIHSLKDYGTFGRIAVRNDNNFRWALEKDTSLSEWVAHASKFMEMALSNVGTQRASINYFLDFLVANPGVTRTPEHYLHREYALVTPFIALTEKHESVLYSFFNYILEIACVSEDDYGHKVRLPGFYNPIEVRTRSSRSAETHREAMPTRYVRMLHDILVSDNFSWAQSFGKARWNRRGGDTFMWLNPETRQFEEVWSPVRTIALLVKLMLPARTFQIRMLDSGEGDTFEYDLGTDAWLTNCGALSPSKNKIVAKGVFARHRERNGQEFVFIRFNTNKTADQNKDASDSGYIMPWQHKEVIKLLTFLRDWQKKYNPISAPTRWVDIKDGSISSRYSRAALEAKGSNCFLFRDPCLPHRDQPVTDSRLSSMWRSLNQELEQRLANTGEKLPDGTPIVLVEKTASGSAIYDLHSLRVTLITALAESGGVPPSVLMKVVGHASVVMTLYYMKLSPSHICDSLNEAEVKLRKREQIDWQAWLSRQSRESLISATAHNSFHAVNSLSEGTQTSWIVRDHGICPVGGTRCQEGGEAIIDTRAYQKWAPVVGGSANCVRCRFFITGPAFLLGLQAYFDNISFKLKDASQRYQAAKLKFESLDATHISKQAVGESISMKEVHELTVASSYFDQRTHEVDNLAHSWHSTYRLIQKCIELSRLNEKKPVLKESQFALVTVGGSHVLEAVLEESSEFEHVDRICQAAVFFDGIDSAAPNLKRMRAFDAMLARNGISPIFFSLDEQVALNIGNQMSAFMYAKLGRESTNALMAGTETLRRLGIEDTLEIQMKKIVPLKIEANALQSQIETRADVAGYGEAL